MVLSVIVIKFLLLYVKEWLSKVLTQRIIVKIATVCMIILCTPMFLVNAQSKNKKILYVNIDEAKIIRLDQKASSVIIGNPGIADVAVYDNSTLVLTGKSYGLTNMIILDEGGQEIVRTNISVRQKDMGAITIYNADKKYTLRCMPRCEPEINISDDPKSYEGLLAGIQNRESIANNSTLNAQVPENETTSYTKK